MCATTTVTPPPPPPKTSAGWPATPAQQLWPTSLPVSDGKTRRLIGPVLAWPCARSVPAQRHSRRDDPVATSFLCDNCCCFVTHSLRGRHTLPDRRHFTPSPRRRSKVLLRRNTQLQPRRPSLTRVLFHSTSQVLPRDFLHVLPRGGLQVPPRGPARRASVAVAASPVPPRGRRRYSDRRRRWPPPLHLSSSGHLLPRGTTLPWLHFHRTQQTVAASMPAPLCSSCRTRRHSHVSYTPAAAAAGCGGGGRGVRVRA